MWKKVECYFNTNNKLPETYLAWPLFGSGVENLGKQGKPVLRKIPDNNENELLMRIDACGLCYTDAKAVLLGSNHPRFIGRDLSKNPVVPGHELTMTVVKVGANLSDRYHIGERYTMQPNIWVNGKSMPFCFEYDGGLRQYAVIGKEIISGDEGNYLIPIEGDISYAASALAEPWSCVEASYRMNYRNSFSSNGTVWFCGCDNSRKEYNLKKIWGKPKQVIASDIPSDLKARLSRFCADNGIQLGIYSFQEVVNKEIKIDDILILDGNASMIDAASKKLNKKGILAILNNKPLNEPIKIDLGKLHYDMITYIGTTSLNIDDAFQSIPIRTELQSKGNCWILGAGGPLGRMHLQRTLEMDRHPKTILATNRGLNRLQTIDDDFSDLSNKKNIAFGAISPTHQNEHYEEYLYNIMQLGGFHDIIVMAANAETVSGAIPYLSQHGVLNLFAGINRGITADVNAWSIYGPKQIRLIGHSGSNLFDQVQTVGKILNGKLRPELAVAAVCGMNQVPDGLQAMIEQKYPGKIVVYPYVIDFPLTALNNFRSQDAEVYNALSNSKFWNFEAEKLFLENHLV